MAQNKVSKVEASFSIGIYVFVLWLCYFRIYTGISIADEPLYTALAYLPRLGGEWFVHDMTIQTTTAILLSPLVLAYDYFFGVEGIMLFTRHLYFFFSLFTSAFTFYFLRQYCRWTAALLLAGVVVAFVPHNMICLNYNSMGCHFFGLAVMASLLSIGQQSQKFAFASGVFWVLCVYSYPTLMLLFLLFCFLFYLINRSEDFVRTRFLKPFLLGLLIPGVILLSVLIYLGLDNIKQAVEFSNHFNMPGQFWKLSYAYTLLMDSLPPGWILLLVFAIWFWLEKRAPQYAVACFVAFLLLFLALGAQKEGVRTHLLWPLVIMLIVYPWMNRKALSRNELRLIQILVVPAIAGVLVTCLTSRMTLYNTYITGLFGALATVALIIRHHVKAAWIVSLIILGATVFYYYDVVYEEGDYSTLNYTVQTGPLKGLETSKARGEFIESIQRDIQSIPLDASIMFKDHFPIGYLMSHRKPLGPTINILPTFWHPEARPLYVDIFRAQKYHADFIVELRYFPVHSQARWVFWDPDRDEKDDPFYNYFLRTNNYKIGLDRGAYRILVKK